jgi:hypothetical protein
MNPSEFILGICFFSSEHRSAIRRYLLEPLTMGMQCCWSSYTSSSSSSIAPSLPVPAAAVLRRRSLHLARRGQQRQQPGENGGSGPSPAGRWWHVGHSFAEKWVSGKKSPPMLRPAAVTFFFCWIFFLLDFCWICVRCRIVRATIFKKSVTTLFKC